MNVEKSKSIGKKMLFPYQFERMRHLKKFNNIRRDKILKLQEKSAVDMPKFSQKIVDFSNHRDNVRHRQEMQLADLQTRELARILLATIELLYLRHKTS